MDKNTNTELTFTMDNWEKYKEWIKERKKLETEAGESLSPAPLCAMAMRDDITNQNAEATA